MGILHTAISECEPETALEEPRISPHDKFPRGTPCDFGELRGVLPPGGEIFYLSGEFREVAPPARLAYTFRWFPLDPDDRETIVVLSLEEQVDGTEVRLIHRGLATEGRRALHEAGWTDSFERLEQLLAEIGQ